MRNAMWEKVSTRSHKPSKIFPFGPDADEVMLFGTVEFTFKEGGGSALDWAARAKLVREGGKVKMGFYQVYMVSGPVGMCDDLGGWRLTWDVGHCCYGCEEVRCRRVQPAFALFISLLERLNVTFLMYLTRPPKLSTKLLQTSSPTSKAEVGTLSNYTLMTLFVQLNLQSLAGKGCP